MCNEKKHITAIQQIDSYDYLTKNQKILIFIIIMANIAEFFDLFLIGFVITILIQEKNWIINSFETSLIISGAGIGTVFGSIIWGYFADKYGRKKSFIFCILIVLISSILSSITPTNNWFFFSFSRMFVGMGVSGINIISIPYVQEFVPTRKRGFLSGLSSSFIPLGLFFGSFVTHYFYSIIGWRGILLSGTIPLILILFFLYFLPESPRYLTTKKFFSKAKESYAWAMNISLKKVGRIKNINKFLNNKKKLEEKYSYFQIIKNNFSSFIIFSFGSFCFIFGSFLIQSCGQIILNNYFININKVTVLFMILAFFDLSGRLTSSFISDYIGRRYTIFIFGFIAFLGSMISAFSEYIDKTFTLFYLSEPWIFFIGMLIIMIFGDGAFGIINVFGGEMFSNKLRSTCLGLSYGIGSTAKIISPIIFEILKEDLLFCFLIIAFMFLFGSFIFLFSKETKNISLEKI